MLLHWFVNTRDDDQNVDVDETHLKPENKPSNKEVLLEIGSGTTTTSFTPKWSKWRGYAASKSGGMNGELDEVFNGRQSLRKAIDNFVEYGNKVLSK